MQVIDQNETFRKFDFSSLISKEDDRSICRIVTDISFKDEARSRLYGYGDTVATTVVGAEQLDQIRAEIRNLKKQKQKLNDEILEHNIKTEIPLSDDVVNTLTVEGLIIIYLYKMNFLDQRFEEYDCSSLIKAEDDVSACNYLFDLLNSKKYITHSFGRQNMGCLFKHHGDTWDLYKKSFLNSVFRYLKKDIEPLDFYAWSYMTTEFLQGDRDKLWNLHWTPDGTDRKWISGLYYLKTQRDNPFSGTEFATGEIGSNHGKFFTNTKERHWTIFPSDIWHRPGKATGTEWRFIVAADLLYSDKNS